VIVSGYAALGLGCIFFLPPVGFQSLVTVVFVWAWSARQWRPVVFLLLSCGATLFVYRVLGYVAYQQTRQLQQEFPVVSLEERLPRTPAHHSHASGPPANFVRFEELESRVEREERRRNPFRMRALRRLHEDTFSIFVNRPGFGAMRMSDVEPLLRAQRRQEIPIGQPGTPSPSAWLPDSLCSPPSTTKEDEALLSMNEESVVDFVNPLGFGFIKDRQHVTGFQEH
jgi:hypothetical protein